MHEPDHLRRLASRLRAHADRPIMTERAALWARLNRLAPGRPLLLVVPEGAWVEILPDSDLLCQAPFHRTLERQEIDQHGW